MNCWIFVLKVKDKNKSTGESFIQLLEKKNWGFQSSRPIKNKINSLQKGDIILFYLGGQNYMYFSGEARLDRNDYLPNRPSIGDSRKLDSMVSFDNIDLFYGKKIYLTRAVREKLEFIKNKDNWGMTFGQGIIKISESDYCDIKKFI